MKSRTKKTWILTTLKLERFCHECTMSAGIVNTLIDGKLGSQTRRKATSFVQHKSRTNTNPFRRTKMGRTKIKAMNVFTAHKKKLFKTNVRTDELIVHLSFALCSLTFLFKCVELDAFTHRPLLYIEIGTRPGGPICRYPANQIIWGD